MSIIDASHWQRDISWPEVAKFGVIGCIHKYSQGEGFHDPAYEARALAARMEGLLWGRYHYGTNGDVHKQVANFLEGAADDEALALDWEDNHENQMTISQAMEFVAGVEKRTGVFPILYSGNLLKEYVVRGAYLGPLLKCRLWLAQYGPHALIPKGWSSYYLWQHTSEGVVPGISGPVDLSRYDDEEELRRTWAPRPAVSV